MQIRLYKLTTDYTASYKLVNNFYYLRNNISQTVILSLNKITVSSFGFEELYYGVMMRIRTTNSDLIKR
jgi:hypothetical protein